jgi:hypothetical protein
VSTYQGPCRSTTDHWNELLSGQVAQGKTRSEATRTLAARYPALRAQMVQEANAGRPAALPAATASNARGDQGPLEADWWRVVAVYVGQGLSRPRAISKAAQTHPQLRAAFVREYNAIHGRG